MLLLLLIQPIIRLLLCFVAFWVYGRAATMRVVAARRRERSSCQGEKHIARTARSGRTAVVLLLHLLLLIGQACCCSGSSSSAAGAAAAAMTRSISRNQIVRNYSLIQELRGGATSKQQGSKKKKKKKTSVDGGEGVQQRQRKKKPTAGTKKKKDDADKVSQILKEKDAAQALGDAIRDRGDQLRREPTQNHPSIMSFSYEIRKSQSIQDSVRSVGWALGASDHARRTPPTNTNLVEEPSGGVEEDDAGGVEVAPEAVVVHYFLKSHGGAHALQCLCSLLSSTAGVGALLLPLLNRKGGAGGGPVLQLTLLKRCLLFAMIKHVAGLVAASFLAAQGIPVAGFRQAVQWMHELATDPVAQYTFYAAIILLWLPNNSHPKVRKGAAAATGVAAEAVAAAAPVVATAAWWQAYRVVPLLLVGPVLLRELISTALVVSDVLVLWACSSTSPSTKSIRRLLSASQAVVNAFMSLLVTPDVWRSATAAERQAILAKLTSKLSLAFEVAVGILLSVDSALGLSAFLFTGTTSNNTKVPFWQLVKRLVCTRLYLQFLWTRRRKIHRLATNIRGGASQVPFYVLSVVLDPRASMGLSNRVDGEDMMATPASSPRRGNTKEEWTWKDYVRIALGLDE